MVHGKECVSLCVGWLLGVDAVGCRSVGSLFLCRFSVCFVQFKSLLQLLFSHPEAQSGSESEGAARPPLTPPPPPANRRTHAHTHTFPFPFNQLLPVADSVATAAPSAAPPLPLAAARLSSPLPPPLTHRPAPSSAATSRQQNGETTRTKRTTHRHTARHLLDTQR